MQRTLGKFTPPKVGRVLVRRRLLAALDAASGRPIIWIDAPAGSGKTILAASYVAAKRCVPLWYSVDAGDSDPASFLHHLAEAARRAYPSRRMRLPRLAADLLPDVAVFTRHFARRMFERIPPRTFLVMDNYQQLLPESPVHALIALIM